MPDWQGFEMAAGRLGDDFSFRTVIIYAWTEEYDAATGTYGDATLDQQARVEAEVREPGMPRTTTGPNGGESEVDVEIYVGASDGDGLVETGETDRASVIEDTLSGTRYTVTEVFPEGQGLYRVSGVER